MKYDKYIRGGGAVSIDASTIIFEDSDQHNGEAVLAEIPDNTRTDTPEGGEGGNPGTTLPPLPPSPASVARKATPLAPVSPADDVYRPAPATNPVIAALHRYDIYVRQAGDRHHRITCPWATEHAPAEGAEAIYIEPSPSRPLGEFTCSPCNGRHRDIMALLDHIEVEPSAARCKPVIRTVKGELHRQTEAAERVLATIGDFYQSAGAIVRIRTDPQTGDIATEMMSEQALSIALSAAADWEAYERSSKSWHRIDVPPRVITALMKNAAFQHLPSLHGLSRQPYLRPGDNSLVTRAGYDAASGMYAAFCEAEYAFPDFTKANAEAAHQARKELLAEFPFALQEDESAALSAILTASVRPALPLAPAYSISASRPGSGKSYLAGLIAKFGTPGEPHNISYPANSEEASKVTLSVLLGRPAVICFDDMTSDWVAYGAINRLLTSETISERVLGASQVATVRTSSLILGTGNNIRPLRDLARRVVSIYLNPRVETITSIRYTNDPIAAIKADRAGYVTYALTIIAAYVAAGCPRSAVPNVASFDVWTRLCRESLIWLGQPDPATSLIAQVNDDPEVQLFGNLLSNWLACFGGKQTTVRALIEKAENDEELMEAIQELPVIERSTINRSKLGRYLSRHANRIVNGLELRQSPTSERNAWTVVAVSNESELPSRAGEPTLERTWRTIEQDPPGVEPGEIF